MEFSGSSRSAVFCRSPRQPFTVMPPSPAIPSWPRTVPGRTCRISRRSRQPTARAGGATVPARSGISFGVTGTTSRVAPWSGSCIFTDYKELCAVRRRRPSPIRRSLARMTRSTGSSWRPCPISSGCRTSPMCRHGREWSTWPSSSMSSPERSWAGAFRHR